MKVCKKCNLEKDFSEFSKSKNGKDGVNSRCKNCRNTYLSEYRKSEFYSDWQTQYRANSKDKIKQYKKTYYLKNIEVLSVKNKNYKELNKEKLREYNNEYISNRLKNDIVYKLLHNIRCLLSKSLKEKGFRKNSRSVEILGCNIDDFKSYLESKFESWMTWENKGLYNGDFDYGWDIDHIIPLSSVDTEDEIIKLNHYTNLQPLCSKINRDIKRNNIDYYSKSPSFDEIK